MPLPIPLALVADQIVFREALAHALAAHGFEVVAQADDAAALDGAAAPLVLLDLEEPATNVDAIHRLRERPSDPRIMVLSASLHPRDVGAAWSAGAHGYTTKNVDFATLLDGLRQVAAGRRYLLPGLTARDDGDDPSAALSRREREVFVLIVRGMTSPAIARELGISVKTVDTHRERVLKKLGLHSAVQLARFAAEQGLL